MNARKRARAQGLPFTLTIDRILNALKRGICEATGIPFDLTPGNGNRRQRRPFVPSVDRKVPELGYTDDNVQIVVFIHNVARGAWGDDSLNTYINHMAQRAKEDS